MSADDFLAIIEELVEGDPMVGTAEGFFDAALGCDVGVDELRVTSDRTPAAEAIESVDVVRVEGGWTLRLTFSSPDELFTDVDNTIVVVEFGPAVRLSGSIDPAAIDDGRALPIDEITLDAVLTEPEAQFFADRLR